MTRTHTPPLACSLALLLISTLALTGCFDAPKPECAFACGDEASCPSGYRCAGDGWCKRDDVPESFTCSTVSLVDGATIDADDVDAALIDATPIDAALVDAADIDAALVDAADIDAAVIDAAVDAAPDAAVDAAIDAGIDAAIDASIDAAVDASIDAAIDAADPI